MGFSSGSGSNPAPRWSRINDYSTDTYIQSTGSMGSTEYRFFSFENFVSDPFYMDPSKTWTIKVRWRRNNTGSSPKTVYLRAEIVNWQTNMYNAPGIGSSTDSWTTTSFTVPVGVKNTIATMANRSNLSLRLEAHQVDSTNWLRVAWAEIVIPEQTRIKVYTFSGWTNALAKRAIGD